MSSVNLIDIPSNTHEEFIDKILKHCNIIILHSADDINSTKAFINDLWKKYGDYIPVIILFRD